MTDVWYYAQRDKPVGPVSLAELNAFLARSAKSEDVLVWQDGFLGWTEAGKVPQLATSTRSRIPPRPITTELASTSTNSAHKRKNKVISSVVATAVGLMVLGGMRGLSQSSGGISAPDPGILIYGKTRDSFVTAGLETCMNKQENDPDNKSLGLSRDKAGKYCSCYMNRLADTMTFGDLKDVPREGSIFHRFQAKIEKASEICISELRRSLLGAAD